MIDDDTTEALMNAPILFGLRAQSRLPVIEAMLLEGYGWDSIAETIGWERGKARSDFERLTGDEDTQELRSALAEAIEVIRAIVKRHGDQWESWERNPATEAYLRGNRLLVSKTAYDI